MPQNDFHYLPVPSEITICYNLSQTNLNANREYHFSGDKQTNGCFYIDKIRRLKSYLSGYVKSHEKSHEGNFETLQQLNNNEKSMPPSCCVVTEAATESTCSTSDNLAEEIDNSCQISLVSALTQDFFELDCLTSIIENNNNTNEDQTEFRDALKPEKMKAWTHGIKSTKIKEGKPRGRKREKHPSILNKIC